MGSLVYIRLIGFTAGTLLQLFWMVVILGYRRQRNFERVFFFLCLALFFFYSGSLLALNAQIHYLEPPALLTAFAKTLLCAGLCLLPPVLIHLHFEYADTREMLASRAWKRVVLLAAYVPALYFALRAYPLLASSPGFDFLVPGNALGRGFGIWLGLAMLLSAAWEGRFMMWAPDRPQALFHGLLAGAFIIGALITVQLFVLVIFFEPLQRVLGRRLQETAHLEMDRVQRLTAEIQQEARQGNAEALARFVEHRVKEIFDLAAVKVRFWEEREIGDHLREFAKHTGMEPPVRGKSRVAFSEGKVSETFATGGNLAGILRAEPHGAALSGE